jgi:hypothetical protein
MSNALNRLSSEMQEFGPIITLPAARIIAREIEQFISARARIIFLQYLGEAEIDKLMTISFLPQKVAIRKCIANKMGNETADAMADKIVDFIEKERFGWQEEVKNSKENLYIRPRSLSLRPLQYNIDGSIFIHFTKKKQGDVIIGSGAYKVVKLALNYFTGEWVASSAIKSFVREGDAKQNYEGNEEVVGLSSTRGTKGILQMLHFVNYRSKKGILKTRILTPLYNYGNLKTYIKAGNIRHEMKLSIAHHLIDALFHLHAKGLLHRDLKPANIFIDKLPCIGDLGTITSFEDHSRLAFHRTTCWWASPEYAKARITGTSLIPVTTDKLDVWSLGCILYDLLYCPREYTSCLPWIGDEITTFQKLSTLNPSWFPEPSEKKSFVHLVWQMLSIDPAKRPSMADVKQTFKDCNEMAGK